MSIIIFIVILLVLVVSHEFGHFIVAKKSGIRVDEFSFGFPPKIIGKKIGETTYNLNLLPFGGYVKIYGENGEEETDEKSKSDSSVRSSDASVKALMEEIIITDTIKKTITNESVSIEETITETDIIDKVEAKSDLLIGSPDTSVEVFRDKSRSFVNKPKYIQALVLVAGIIMNLLVAWLLLSVGYMSGLPSSVSMAPKGVIINNQHLTITSVVKGSPAELSGFKIGDKLISLETSTDSTKLLSSNFGAETVQNFVKKHGEEIINVEILRGPENKVINVTPIKANAESNPAIGISMDMIGTLKLPVHKAVWEGLKLTVDLTIGTAVGFYHLIAGALTGHGDMSSITGPIGIVGVVGDAAKFGFIYLLSFTALISINLAVINLLPFPALDGGRLLFLLIEKIKGSRIKPEVANWANTIGFGLLMLLMAVITFHDIVKLF